MRPKHIALLSDNIDIILCTERYEKQIDLAQADGLHQSAVASILVGRNRRRSSYQPSARVRLNERLSRRQIITNVFDELIVWLNNADSDRLQLSHHTLLAKAKIMYAKRGSACATMKWDQRCIMNYSWLGYPQRSPHNWDLKHHGLWYKRLYCERNSTDSALAKEWRNKIVPEVISDYFLRGVYNWDEAALSWKILPNAQLYILLALSALCTSSIRGAVSRNNQVESEKELWIEKWTVCA